MVTKYHQSSHDSIVKNYLINGKNRKHVSLILKKVMTIGNVSDWITHCVTLCFTINKPDFTPDMLKNIEEYWYKFTRKILSKSKSYFGWNEKKTKVMMSIL